MLEPVWPVLHVYDTAPLAFKVVGLPEQIVGDVAEAVTLGVVFTVTVTVSGETAAHPELFPFTVYVVVTAGLTVMLDVVAPVFQV